MYVSVPMFVLGHRRQYTKKKAKKKWYAMHIQLGFECVSVCVCPRGMLQKQLLGDYSKQ